MRPEDMERLRHMLDAANEALSFAEKKFREDLDTDRQLTLALVKAIEIIGEAAYKMSEEARLGLDNIPWPAVINMRHRLVHVYYDINLEVLWKTLREDLPPLIAALEIALGESG